MTNPINDNFNVQSSAVPAPIAKPVDSKDLISGQDNRAEAQGGTNPLKGNDTPVRDENNDSAGA